MLDAFRIGRFHRDAAHGLRRGRLFDDPGVGLFLREAQHDLVVLFHRDLEPVHGAGRHQEPDLRQIAFVVQAERRDRHNIQAPQIHVRGGAAKDEFAVVDPIPALDVQGISRTRGMGHVHEDLFGGELQAYAVGPGQARSLSACLHEPGEQFHIGSQGRDAQADRVVWGGQGRHDDPIL